MDSAQVILKNIKHVLKLEDVHSDADFARLSQVTIHQRLVAAEKMLLPRGIATIYSHWLQLRLQQIPDKIETHVLVAKFCKFLLKRSGIGSTMLRELWRDCTKRALDGPYRTRSDEVRSRMAALDKELSHQNLRRHSRKSREIRLNDPGLTKRVRLNDGGGGNDNANQPAAQPLPSFHTAPVHRPAARPAPAWGNVPDEDYQCPYCREYGTHYDKDCPRVQSILDDASAPKKPDADARKPNRTHKCIYCRAKGDHFDEDCPSKGDSPAGARRPQPEDILLERPDDGKRWRSKLEAEKKRKAADGATPDVMLVATVGVGAADVETAPGGATPAANPVETEGSDDEALFLPENRDSSLEPGEIESGPSQSRRDSRGERVAESADQSHPSEGGHRRESLKLSERVTRPISSASTPRDNSSRAGEQSHRNRGRKRSRRMFSSDDENDPFASPDPQAVDEPRIVEKPPTLKRARVAELIRLPRSPSSTDDVTLAQARSSKQSSATPGAAMTTREPSGIVKGSSDDRASQRRGSPQRQPPSPQSENRVHRQRSAFFTELETRAGERGRLTATQRDGRWDFPRAAYRAQRARLMASPIDNGPDFHGCARLLPGNGGNNPVVHGRDVSRGDFDQAVLVHRTRGQGRQDTATGDGGVFIKREPGVPFVPDASMEFEDVTHEIEAMEAAERAAASLAATEAEPIAPDPAPTPVNVSKAPCAAGLDIEAATISLNKPGGDPADPIEGGLPPCGTWDPGFATAGPTEVEIKEECSSRTSGDDSRLLRRGAED